MGPKRVRGGKLISSRTTYVACLGQELSYMGLDLETLPITSWREDLPTVRYSMPPMRGLAGE